MSHSMTRENSDDVKLPAELDENGWHLILNNCNAFHGWYLDEVTNQIKIASRPGKSDASNRTRWEADGMMD